LSQCISLSVLLWSTFYCSEPRTPVQGLRGEFSWRRPYPLREISPLSLIPFYFPTHPPSAYPPTSGHNLNSLLPSDVSLFFSTSARSFSGSSIDPSLSFSLFLHPQVTFVLISKSPPTPPPPSKQCAAPTQLFSLNSAMT
jgi:hypothetical protein